MTNVTEILGQENTAANTAVLSVGDANKRVDQANRAIKETRSLFYQYLDTEDSATIDEFFEKLLARWSFMMSVERHFQHFNREKDFLKSILSEVNEN